MRGGLRANGPGRARALAAALLAAVVLAAAVPGGAHPLQEEPPPPPEEPRESEPAPAGEEGTGGAESGEEVTPDEAAEKPLAPRRLPAYVPDAERSKVEVEFSADGECDLSVDGESLGRLEPGVPASFEVASGPRQVKAVSTEAPGAVWSRVVRIREGSEQKVQVKMARPLRDERRRQRRELIYRDRERGLLWTRRDNGTDVRWVEARGYCEELRLGGLDGWRLPTRSELHGIHAPWSQAAFKVIGAFTLSACCPWSSELEGEERAWNYNFRFRKPFLGDQDYSIGLRALCVRPDDEAVAGDAGEETEGGDRPGNKRRSGADGLSRRPPAWYHEDDPTEGRR